MSSNRIRIDKSCKIYNDEYVIKKKNKDINYLYDYLRSCEFYEFPDLIDEYENTYKYAYLNSTRDSTNTDTLEALGQLHNKTKSSKTIDINKINEIKSDIEDNIIDVEYFYENLFNNIENEEYHSPSTYLLIRNCSILLSLIKYAKDTLNKWYDTMKDKKSTNVSLIHGNPKVEHTIYNEKPYLISFDNYSIDNSILDIYKFYKNEDYDIDIINNLDKYYKINELNEEDKLFLNVLLSIPYKVDLSNNEITNTNNVRKFIDTLYQINSFIFKDKNT